MKTDTIVAIATALSNAGIGIIRISGKESLEVANRIFRTKNNKKNLFDFHSHTIHYGFIYDGVEVVDEVMISIMKSPNSFTTEDTVEINCHGGVFILNKILSLTLKNGARLAEPGEFSKRAFLNGRIDLSKAEAIMDLIHAKNELSLKSSLKQLSGSIFNLIQELRNEILYEIAFIESALDDPEYITLDGYLDKLEGIISSIIYNLNNLYDSFGNGKLIHEGIKTVILGKPNAGKSSFLNKMVGEEKAIVTDIAGTTRDILEQHIMLDSISLHMIDTAGIRNTDNEVEKIGVARTIEQGEDADLIIYMIDSSISLDDNDLEIMRFIQDKKFLILLNKSDLSPVVSKKTVTDIFFLATGNDLLYTEHMFDISIVDNIGLDLVKNFITELFFNNEIMTNNEVVITNLRHKELIGESLESLRQVVNSISLEMPEDFLTIDLMSAYVSLGFIIGEEVTEDLVNEIFSKFCTGK